MEKQSSALYNLFALHVGRYNFSLPLALPRHFSEYWQASLAFIRGSYVSMPAVEHGVT
jgi:hypothetical protein